MYGWILILTISTHVHSGTAITVTPIGDFADKRSCVAAGNEWLSSTQGKDYYVNWRHALCVPQKAAP